MSISKKGGDVPKPCWWTDRRYARTSVGFGRRAGIPISRACHARPVVREVARARRCRPTRLRALDVGRGAQFGGGRRTKDDAIDHAVGVVCHVKRGESVRRGHLLADVHASDEESAARGVVAVLAAYELGERRRTRTGSSSTSSSSTARIHARAPGGRDDPLAAGAAARGRTLVRVEILDPRLTRPSISSRSPRSSRRSVRSVGRRGKYLVLRLESGLALLVHRA